MKRLRHYRTGHGWRWVAAALAVALLLPAVALATPPTNDDRVNAEMIPAFPATVQGTTVEATVERLDPQVSECGRIEGTVWYRITQAPDGTVGISVGGAGFVPVVRVYNARTSGIDEIACSSAAAGRLAQVSFETQRGSSYLVLVGKKPGTADAAFQLTARLFLPPKNDTQGQARRIVKLPASVTGSTFGATGDDNDPEDCGLAGGTVWYAIAPGRAERLIVRLHAKGGLDASIAVIRRIRSEQDSAGCKQTDRKGNAVLPITVTKGAGYLVVIGPRGASPPGDFTLSVIAAQPPERAPGHRLSSHGVRSTLNGLTDVNDIWWASLTAGETYRIGFTSKGCASLSLRRSSETLRELQCNGYTTFTPGPDGGGRYVFEVRAPAGARTTGYRLRVAAAGRDDVGVGLELRNLEPARGSLAPSSIDVVDVYHFDVVERSEVRLRLATPAQYSLVLLTDYGSQVRSTDRGQLRLQLERGRYVVAVRGAVGTSAARYTLSLVVRRLTSTTLVAPSTEITPGSTVTLTVATSPAPDLGWTELQIDRFDPLTGWQFNRLVRVRAPGGSVSWTPPAPGRWRARATFLGTLRFSPSRSGYAMLLIATPLPGSESGY